MTRVTDNLVLSTHTSQGDDGTSAEWGVCSGRERLPPRGQSPTAVAPTLQDQSRYAAEALSEWGVYLLVPDQQALCTSVFIGGGPFVGDYHQAAVRVCIEGLGRMVTISDSFPSVVGRSNR